MLTNPTGNDVIDDVIIAIFLYFYIYENISFNCLQLMLIQLDYHINWQ